MTGLPFGFTVTVYREPTEKDRWGDGAGGPPHTVNGCAFYLPSSSELTDARDTLLDRGVLLAPYGADIKPTDKVELPAVDAVPAQYRGVWRVDGSGAQWRSPLTAWQAGAEFQIRREQG